MEKLEDILKATCGLSGLAYFGGVTLYSLGMGVYEGATGQGFMGQGSGIPLEENVEVGLIAGIVPAGLVMGAGAYPDTDLALTIILTSFLDPIIPLMAHTVGYGLGKLSDVMI
jgi:hypothetical protein